MQKVSKEQMELLQKRTVRQAEIAAELTAKNPTLGSLTALIMAGDLASAEYVESEFLAGRITFEQADVYLGSFARFEFIVRWVEQGKVKPEDAYALLPGLWSGSDPDDTDPRFLDFWQSAFKANNNVVISDDYAFDYSYPTRKVFTVYRGQDRHLYYESGVLGIAWSLDKNIARKFARGAWARQSNRPGEIITATVQKKHVLAYITGRGESEIILDPKQTKFKRKENV